MRSETQQILDEMQYEAAHRLTFEEWMDALDELTLGKYGLSTEDLPLGFYESHYRRGLTPHQYLTRAIKHFLREKRRETEVATLFREGQQAGCGLTNPYALSEAGLDCTADAPTGDEDPMVAAYGPLDDEQLDEDAP